NPQEPIAVIELFSEQSVCLASLDVEPPPSGPIEQTTHVDLSDGRSVELAIAFTGPWPTVRAVYRDSWLATNARATVETHNGLSLAPAKGMETARPRPWLALFVPRTWRGRLAVAVIGVWLLFFTPGTDASAASRVFDLALRAGAVLMR